MLELSSIKLAKVVEAKNQPEEVLITNISTNSREVKSGEAFLALKGEKFDGHDFAGDAYKNGASLLIVNHLIENVPENRQVLVADTARAYGLLGRYNRRQFKGTVIALTGSAGKTSVTAYLAELLDIITGDVGCLDGGMVKRFARNGRPGNFNPGRRYWVFEADESDKSLLNYQIDYAIILNIGCDHYSEDELVRVFGEFSTHIRKGLITSPAVFKKLKFLIPASLKVVLVDDPNNPASDTASDITVTGYHIINGEIAAEFNNNLVELPQPGLHTAVNIAMVAGMCNMLGFEWSEIIPAIKELRGVARRFDFAGEKNGIRIYDDYAHNPQKLCCCLKTAQSIAEGKVIMIWQPHGYGPLGFMRDELARELSSVLRSNDIFILLEPFYAGGTSSFKPHAAEVITQWHNSGILKNATTVPDRKEVEYLLKEQVNPGDIVLVCGARDNSIPGWAESLVAKI